MDKIVIKYVDTSTVKPYPNNPRNNLNGVARVKKSIENYGMLQPISVDPDMVIVTGHTRYAAAVELGMKKIPIVVYDNLSENQLRAYRIDDNKSADFSFFDDQKLRDEFTVLTEAGFDLSSLTFGENEILSIVEDWQPIIPNAATTANPDIEMPKNEDILSKIKIEVPDKDLNDAKAWLQKNFVSQFQNSIVK